MLEQTLEPGSTAGVESGPHLAVLGEGPRAHASPEDFPPTRVRLTVSALSQPFVTNDLAAEPNATHADVAEKLKRAFAVMPAAGSSFLGFKLVSELGRGAFGRVYLAQQGELADRFVVLKVAANVTEESQALAQLLHTNIVPIYSIHRAYPLQAVCMPYVGSTTLADLLADMRLRATLPDSGKTVVESLLAHRSTLETSESLRRNLPEAPSAVGSTACDPSAAPLPDQSAQPILDMLARCDYVQAVLWLVGRVADGLAHAHERGIIHRDLKPANILLTDEGQPMLLDFNLSEDTKLRGNLQAARVGGTLPYMAPEQLRALYGAPERIDCRADLYALGVILFELLTGHYPYPIRFESASATLPGMIADRKRVPPLRQFNPTAAPGLEAIVGKCLAADADRRYACARDLREDIERHVQNLPLRYAPNPSWRERVQKWARRHPRLASTASVGVCAALLVVASLTALAWQTQRFARANAFVTLEQFRDDFRAIQFHLNVRGGEAEHLQAGVARAGTALKRYSILERDDWEAQPTVQQLTSEGRARLRAELGELLLLLARATQRQSAGPGSRRDVELLEQALRLNHKAESCFPADGTPRAVLLQRAELLERLGAAADGQRLREAALQIPRQSAQDHYLEGSQSAAQGRFAEAVPLLREATQLDPQSFWPWFVLGYCHDQLAQDNDALGCYTICVALRPEFPWSYFNRGLTRLRQREFRRAFIDFSAVLEREPTASEALINRAIARQGLGEHAQAVVDLSRALELGTSHTRVYFMRAQARAKAGDAAGAEADRAEGLRREPNDEHGWLARGLAQLSRDPNAALADFEKALERNPRSFAGLKNKAYVLAELLNDVQAAIGVLDEALRLYPDSVQLLGGRGVYFARLGKRDAALKDSQACELLDTSPSTLYQLACIWSLTSQSQPEDRREATRLLSAALRKGFDRFDILDKDKDLDPIRGTPELVQLIAAARRLHHSPRQ